MAIIFVSSVDGNNADSGADWTNAKATVPGALAIAVDGDIIKVDSAHNATATAAITWTPPAGRVAIISVNRAASDAWLAGATESVGAASAAFTVASAAGSAMYVFGMVLNGGTNNASTCNIALLSTTAVTCFLELVSCTLDLKTAAASTFIGIGPNSGGSSRVANLRATNCTFICSGSRAGVFFTVGRCNIEFTNPTFSPTGGTKPVSLFSPGDAGVGPVIVVRDGDISGYAVSGGAYFAVASMNGANLKFENLKISATPTITSGTWSGSGDLTLRNVDSGDTINVFEYRNAYGTITENTSIYANSGATFNSVGISWEVITTAACNESFPFVLPPMSVWISTTGSVGVAVDVVHDSVTNLTDRNFWIEASYPSSASFPSYSVISDRNANPFTGSAVDQSSSSTTYTGTGGFSNPNKQESSVSFTAAEVGLLRIRPVVAATSKTLYLSPAARVS